MAAGPRLRAYLALERAMVDLDDIGDPVADELRDRMDPIWFRLSDEERTALDSRLGDASVFAGDIVHRSIVTSRIRRDLAVRRTVRAHFTRAA